MVNSETKTRDLVWLKLRDYHVVAMKPEFDQHAIELESAIQGGMPAYPDLAEWIFMMSCSRMAGPTFTYTAIGTPSIWSPIPFRRLIRFLISITTAL